jgi:hypothetical protein
MSIKPSIAFGLCCALTLLSALVSAGFSFAALTGLATFNALGWYAFSRSISLPIVVLAAIATRSRAAVLTMAFTMTLVQLFDGIIGIFMKDPAKTYGPFVLAIMTGASAVILLRRKEE